MGSKTSVALDSLVQCTQGHNIYYVYADMCCVVYSGFIRGLLLLETVGETNSKCPMRSTEKQELAFCVYVLNDLVIVKCWFQLIAFPSSVFICTCQYCKSHQFNGINKDVNVSATGHGEATLTVSITYFLFHIVLSVVYCGILFKSWIIVNSLAMFPQ